MDQLIKIHIDQQNGDVGDGDSNELSISLLFLLYRVGTNLIF